MTKPNTFSLSLQKQFENKRIIDDCELNQTFTDLKFGSLVRRSNIVKKRGRDTLTLLFAFVLLPFLKRSLTGFWNCRYLHNYVQAHKDTFYRFLNNEFFTIINLMPFSFSLPRIRLLSTPPSPCVLTTRKSFIVSSTTFF